MDCPICKTPMLILEFNQVEIDHCAACGGIWFDSGELEFLLGNQVKSASLLNSFKTEPAAAERKHKCPICRKRMDKVRCGPDGSILIDTCVRGDGLWFDRGELYELVKAERVDETGEILALIKDVFRHSIDN